MRSFLFIIIVLFTISLSAQPKGWKAKENTHTIVYTPTNGSYFYFIAYKPKKIKVGQRKKWLTKVIKGFEKVYDKTPEWEIEQTESGEWIATAHVVYKGKKTIVSYHTVSTSTIDTYIINASGSPKLFDKYVKLYYSSIAKNATKRFHLTDPVTKKIDSLSHKKIEKKLPSKPKTKDSIATKRPIKPRKKDKEKDKISTKRSSPKTKKNKISAQKSSLKTRKVKRPKFNTISLPSSVNNYVYYLHYNYNDPNASPFFESILTFSNGSCTRDIETVLNEGITISKRKHPKDWGKYKINEFNKLEIKWQNEHRFYKQNIFRTLKTFPFKLDNCWNNYSSSDMKVYLGKKTTVLAINQWCFYKNGRFDNGETQSITKTGVDKNGNTVYLISEPGSGEKSGWYSINGNVLQLVYDNGKTLITAIGYDELSNEEKSDLYIGSKRFTNL